MNNIVAYYHYSNYKDMLKHVTRQIKAAYTNIRLTTHPDRHAAFLTLANPMIFIYWWGCINVG